ncbi:MAG: DMT family transporter [Bacteroidales bacterium]|jgi:drug/metabolite transporter (DMT)-like permease|nr:DMT family transporter [Bacteroidales bacterium]HOL98713.1 DMT family transporter [Bacteroidales bacterium]HOM36979.1 DMT family transporter [Bacteroidales bacterium]HPD24598.1 DMT family transporter [Bacteroidales bacterium]HRT00378.1 DMT family transporter [Bacteroidales bacterium]
MNFDKKLIKVYIFLIFSMILWGSSFVWGKIALNFYGTNTIVFLRLLVSTIVLLPILIFLKKLRIPKLKDLPLFLLLAFFEPFLYFLGETNGLRYLSPSISAVFIAVIPLFTPFIAWYFLKEKISMITLSGIIISILGICVLVLGKNLNLEVSPKGILLTMIAILAANGYSVMIKKIPDAYSIFTIILWQNILGLIFFLPLFLLTGAKDIFETGLLREPLIAIINLGIFASTLAFLFYMYGLKFMSISKVNVFTNTIPIFTIFISWLFYDEALTAKKLIAVLIVVAGVIISQLKLKSEKISADIK